MEISKLLLLSKHFSNGFLGILEEEKCAGASTLHHPSPLTLLSPKNIVKCVHLTMVKMVAVVVVVVAMVVIVVLLS